MDENLSRGYVQLGKARGMNEFKFSNGFTHLSPPVDKCNFIYSALMLGGIGFLLPYNRSRRNQTLYSSVCRQSSVKDLCTFNLRSFLESKIELVVYACACLCRTPKPRIPYVLIYIGSLHNADSYNAIRRS